MKYTKPHPLNISVDYKPFVSEKRIQDKKSAAVINGLIVPRGNPYQFAGNSELLLIENEEKNKIVAPSSL